MKVVRGRETQFQSHRRARERLTHRGAHEEDNSPHPLAWKVRGAKFELWQPTRLKGQQTWLG